MMQTQRYDHAVVIGGSMAGLFAARVLSDYFERVTIVERDRLPEDAEFRGGAPQARHLHVLLARGQRVMESLFPQLPQELEDIGAPKSQWGVDTVEANKHGFLPELESGVWSHNVSRLALEHLIRERVRGINNIEFMSGYRACGLLMDASGMFVTGIKAEARRSRTVEDVTADFVVDASGRTSETPEWLQQAGYEAPEETYINAHVGYSSVWFERPENAPDWHSFSSRGTAENGWRSGIIYQVEGNRWTVILTSTNKDYPPTNLEDFLEFSKTVPSPLFYEFIKDAEPISPVYGYRRTHNHWRHYEKLSRRPENFIITGDAAVAFNPVYGQGMSMAAMDAELLDDMLREWQHSDLKGFADQYQKKLAKLVQVPWGLATSGDLKQPSVDTEGDVPQPNVFSNLMDQYFAAMFEAMDYDPVLRIRFLEVMNLLKSPATLLTPGIILRVLYRKLFDKPEKHSQSQSQKKAVPTAL